MLTIKVTKDHLEKGKRGVPRACPVSLALKDALGTPYAIAVGDSYFRYPEYGPEIELPATVVKAIKAIDFASPIEPFSFEIPDPRES